MEHNPIATANASALTAALIYVVCFLSVALFPDLALTVAKSWFHGVELIGGSAWSASPVSFILGLLTLVGGAWLVGYIFAGIYNYFVRKQ